MATFDIVTSNVCGNPIRAKAAVRARIRRAMRLGPPISTVNFGQELAGSNKFRVPPRSGNYAETWADIALALGRKSYGKPHEVPVAVPKGWKVLSQSTRQLHGGKRRVSPARFVTIVVVRFEDGLEVTFANCHTVSKPRRGVPAASWRIAHYATYLGKLGEIVAEQHAQGRTVVFGGDMNHRAKGLPQIHPYQRVIVSSGLDHLWYVPAGGHRVTVSHHRRIRRTALMDHPILAATLKVEKAA